MPSPPLFDPPFPSIKTSLQSPAQLSRQIHLSTYLITKPVFQYLTHSPKPSNHPFSPPQPIAPIKSLRATPTPPSERAVATCNNYCRLPPTARQESRGTFTWQYRRRYVTLPYACDRYFQTTPHRIRPTLKASHGRHDLPN